jgi:hypothetical protein
MTLLERLALNDAMSRADATAFAAASAAVHARFLRRDPPLAQLTRPDPLTSHDLPSLDGIKVIETGNGVLAWQRRQ